MTSFLLFNFEILTYLYVLRSHEFIYAIFTVIYTCMGVYGCMSILYVCVCMWENTIVSKTVYCIEFKFGICITIQSQTNPIDFNKCRVYSFFFFFFFPQEYKKELIYITDYGIKLWMCKCLNCAFDRAQIWSVHYMSPSCELNRIWWI